MLSEAHFALLVFPFMWRDIAEGIKPWPFSTPSVAPSLGWNDSHRWQFGRTEHARLSVFLPSSPWEPDTTGSVCVC